MTVQFTTLGALVGLAIAIALIVKRFSPAYSLILGALIGGIIGGGSLTGTVNTMVSGAGSMMSSILRILTSGALAGALIKTGSAEKIAQTIVDKLGQKRAVIAISIATMIICAVGVFIDISVITVANASDLDIAAETFADLNTAYFSGDAIDLEKEAYGIALWDRVPADMTAYYISTIVDDRKANPEGHHRISLDF